MSNIESNRTHDKDKQMRFNCVQLPMTETDRLHYHLTQFNKIILSSSTSNIQTAPNLSH